MATRKKFDVYCPCPRKKKFPIVLEYQEGKLEGSTSKELECPFCKDLLTIELPASEVGASTIIPDTDVLRSPPKKID